MSSNGFVQIIEFTTSDFDTVRKVDEEWTKATEGKRTARRQIVTRDRNQPDRYLALIFFDSYQSAMENSNLDETRRFAERYRAATNDITFHDLDVIDDSEL
jgi:hypothetical protein